MAGIQVPAPSRLPWGLHWWEAGVRSQVQELPLQCRMCGCGHPNCWAKGMLLTHHFQIIIHMRLNVSLRNEMAMGSGGTSETPCGAVVVLCYSMCSYTNSKYFYCGITWVPRATGDPGGCGHHAQAVCPSLWFPNFPRAQC